MTDRRTLGTGNNAAANAAAGTAAVLFGASVVAVRIAVRDVPPLTLAVLRFGQGSLVLLAGLAAFRRDLLRVDRRDLPYLALLGLFLFAIFPATFNAGVQRVEASRAALILATMPLWTLLLGRLAVRERLSARQMAGVLTSIVGVGIVMVDRGTARGSAIGDVLLISTAICGAMYAVLAKRALAKYAGLTVTFYAMMFGTLFLLPASTRPAALSSETLAMVAFLGVFGGAIAFSLWTIALRRLSPTQVAVYINLNPVAATLLAATVLHERLSAQFLLGFVTVVTGVFIVNWMPARASDSVPQGSAASGAGAP
jgi:drug/metabolite transporter (DMT)-like permease